MIWNPTDYSFSGFRRITGRVSCARSPASAVPRLFYVGLYASYATAAVNVYRCSRKTSTFHGGRLTILAPSDVYYGIRWENIHPPDLERPRGDRRDQRHGLRQMLRRARHQPPGVAGGVQRLGLRRDRQPLPERPHERPRPLRLQARFHHGRRAGRSGGAVPRCRREGTFSNLYEDNATIGSVSAHGNTEHYHFHGQFNGGMQFGGNHGE